ncbi:MAG TPA: YggS family pyridoxal phosphate-dependent enzyme [Anaerolineales bacterium]|nr:YggS family pyridoxal phosphate-dependent enzyme [Anaerolineales bacterium]HRQ91410.1 YggS family pyridoxal phosphate-dependent enzyme [Anaerolineales bacterium]
MSYPQRLEHNLAEVQGRMKAAAQQAGRAAGDVRLLAVTKGHPPEALQALLALGISDIGESYLNEALEKQTVLQGSDLRWHMIGHVQSRKAREVAAHFSVVHSLDSLKLAERLHRFAQELSLRLPVLLECNVSGEITKQGWRCHDDAGEFFADAQVIADLDGLELRGLMSMAPITARPAEARPYFERTRQLRDTLAERLGIVLPELSMGMSNDYEAAILEGATIVRIGEGLMGPRPK